MARAPQLVAAACVWLAAALLGGVVMTTVAGVRLGDEDLEAAAMPWTAPDGADDALLEAVLRTVDEGAPKGGKKKKGKKVKVKRKALRELLLKIEEMENAGPPENKTCLDIFEEKTLHHFMDGNESCQDMKDIVTYTEVQGAFEKSKEKVTTMLREKGKGRGEPEKREVHAPKYKDDSLADRGMPEDDDDDAARDGKDAKLQIPGADHYVMPRQCEKCMDKLVKETEGYEHHCEDPVFMAAVVRSMARSIGATCAKVIRDGRPKAEKKEMKKKEEKKKEMKKKEGKGKGKEQALGEIKENIEEGADHVHVTNQKAFHVGDEIMIRDDKPEIMEVKSVENASVLDIVQPAIRDHKIGAPVVKVKDGGKSGKGKEPDLPNEDENGDVEIEKETLDKLLKKASGNAYVDVSGKTTTHIKENVARNRTSSSSSSSSV